MKATRILALVVSLSLVACAPSQRDDNPRSTNGPETDWTRFATSAFDFSLEIPSSGWSVEVDSSFPLSPKFNFFPIEIDSTMLPLDHVANATHLSICPKGIPSEDVFSPTAEFTMQPNFKVSSESKMYLLEDGTPFAALVRPVRQPSSWTDAGFIWMRVEIDGLEVECERDGQLIDRAECDPLSGNDVIRRTGSVDTTDWVVHEKMLTSLQLSSVPDSTTDVVVSRPNEGETVGSPLVVEGQARGTWFFEGDFPLVLTDWDGRIIAESYASASGEWMTTDFVAFEGTLTFESPVGPEDPAYMQRGTLVLRKDNPSGRPELDDAVEVTVRFQPRGSLSSELEEVGRP